MFESRDFVLELTYDTRESSCRNFREDKDQHGGVMAFLAHLFPAFLLCRTSVSVPVLRGDGGNES